MTIKEQLLQEIEQAPDALLVEVMNLFQQAKQRYANKKGFMRFAGIAQDESALLQEIESEIEINRELDIIRAIET
jgi:hypothetical protein